MVHLQGRSDIHLMSEPMKIVSEKKHSQNKMWIGWLF